MAFFPIIKGIEKGNKTATGGKILHITFQHSSYNGLYFSASLHFSQSWIKFTKATSYIRLAKHYGLSLQEQVTKCLPSKQTHTADGNPSLSVELKNKALSCNTRSTWKVLLTRRKTSGRECLYMEHSCWISKRKCEFAFVSLSIVWLLCKQLQGNIRKIQTERLRRFLGQCVHNAFP